ncbi:MAG TPA: hypothetical protein VFZ57_00090, partial [Thermoanaerobaculia bacterium]|nr:hypothetical protein [Thermoanaerobaculia bacterium]
MKAASVTWRQIMTGTRDWAAAVLCAGIAARCAGPGTSAPPSSAASVAPAVPRCEQGTLGFEAGPISRPIRKRLALPEGARGAIVLEVLPGGPGAAAGIVKNDIV